MLVTRVPAGHRVLPLSIAERFLLAPRYGDKEEEGCVPGTSSAATAEWEEYVGE